MRLTLSTSGNLDVVVKNLILIGFVEKIVNEHDRRARVLRLTPAGKQKVKDFFPSHNQALARIFGHLTKDEKRTTIKTLNQLHKKLPQAMERKAIHV